MQNQGSECLLKSWLWIVQGLLRVGPRLAGLPYTLTQVPWDSLFSKGLYWMFQKSQGPCKE